MKTSIKFYSLAFMFLFLGLNINTTFAQDSVSVAKTKQEIKAEKKAAKKAKKEERKKEKLAAEQQEHTAAVSGIETKQFTLEATQAYDRRGNSVTVTSDLNFVQVNGDHAVVQLAFPQLVGFNGVGGITVDGNISDYKIKKNEKNQHITVSFHVQGPTLMAEVTIDLDGDGNWADSRVDGDFGPAELKFRGTLVPNHQSDAYEGSTRY